MSFIVLEDMTLLISTGLKLTEIKSKQLFKTFFGRYTRFTCITARVGDVINGDISQVARPGPCLKDNGKLAVATNRNGGLFPGGPLIACLLPQSQKLVTDASLEQDLESSDLSAIHVVPEGKVTVGSRLVVHGALKQSLVLGVGWGGALHI